MSSEDTNILEINQQQKSDKHHLLFMWILNLWHKRLMDVKIIPKKSLKYLQYSHYVYRGKDCMKMFSKFLREHAMKLINFKKTEAIKKRTARIKYKSKNMLYL